MNWVFKLHKPCPNYYYYNFNYCIFFFLGKDHEPGILIIILNYTGDRLNFGLAIERARSYNINVEMCIVNDDCAIKNYIPSVGRRGLAGAVLINKIACALSDKGWCLKDISSFINCILAEKRIKSIGISINKDNVELGKGVHGEPGSMFLKLDSEDYRSMVNKMLNTLFEDLPKSSKHFFILINNLGGHTATEMCTIRNEVILQLKDEYRDYFNNGVVRIYCGTYLTSLNVKGFSISILLGDELITECMDHLCDTDAWKASYINLENYLYDDIFIKNKYSIEIENIEPTGPKLSSNGSKVQLHLML